VFLSVCPGKRRDIAANYAMPTLSTFFKFIIHQLSHHWTL